MPRYVFVVVLLAAFCVMDKPSSSRATTKELGIYDRQRLVAWCIVPFDSKKRSPAERVEMLQRLGITRVAYDWREEHVREFEEEVRQYQQHDIEFFAFWNWHPEIEPLIRKYGIRPQIWTVLVDPEERDPDSRVRAAASRLLPLVEKTRELGLSLGLYNHGGWGGQPENLVAVCKHLRTHHDALHVGIVYNFHHAHDRIEGFPETFGALRPFLICLNLNGMNDQAQPKILPIGTGAHEEHMIREVIDSGYDGPIGILDHRMGLDAEESLRQNLKGLDQLIARVAAEADESRPTATARPTPEDTTQNELDLRNWTPLPRDSNAGPEWRHSNEASWRDGRLQEMDFGPVLSATLPTRGQPGDANDLSGGKLLARSAEDDQVSVAYRGLAIRLDRNSERPAITVFDRDLLQLQSAWVGGDLVHSPARFGFMNIPVNAAPLFFRYPSSIAWADSAGKFESDRPSKFFPLATTHARYRGYHLRGDRVIVEYEVGGVRVRECQVIERRGEVEGLARHLEVAPSERLLQCRIRPLASVGDVALFVSAGQAEIREQEGWQILEIAPAPDPRRLKISYAARDAAKLDAPAESLTECLNRIGKRRWPETIRTRTVRVGELGPYIHERIVPPFENPWNALVFLSGIDFLPDGRAVVCSAHGDVWLISRLDSSRPVWQRFATGLREPLGLRIVDGQIFVIERGQLTRLEDVNGDGEADWYECVNNRWHCSGLPHAYDLGLEVDLQGRFYFIKSGGWNTPTGGCLLQIAADGAGDARIFSTGYRHDFGMGISPDGRITTAGQQGNWIPTTRIDFARQGGFYGMMNVHHREEPPATFDRPLIWLPLDADSSAANQIWAPRDWGPLGGSMLHLSWGQCRLLRIVAETVGGISQAAADSLPFQEFAAGPARARFSHRDGALYIAGLKGWQTRGPEDGTLERIRFVPGKSADMPILDQWHTLPDGIAVKFATALDPQSAVDTSNWQARQWNYHWSSEYGSDHWSARQWGVQAEDVLEVRSASLAPDGQTVRLEIPDLQPAMQTQIVFEITTAVGEPLSDVFYATTHQLPCPTASRLPESLLPSIEGAWTSSNHFVTRLGENGTWHLTSQRQDDQPSWALSERTYCDFEIEVEYQTSAEAALLIRAQERQGDFPWTYRIVLGPDRIGDVAHNRTDVYSPSSVERSQHAPDRKRLRAVFRGRHLQAWVNGEMALDYVEPDTRVPCFGRVGFAVGGESGSSLQIYSARISRLCEDR